MVIRQYTNLMKSTTFKQFSFPPEYKKINVVEKRYPG